VGGAADSRKAGCSRQKILASVRLMATCKMYMRGSGAAESTAVRGKRNFGRGTRAKVRPPAEDLLNLCVLPTCAVAAFPLLLQCRSMLLQCHDAVAATVQPCNRLAATPSSCSKLLLTHCVAASIAIMMHIV
jgi:hypothetical protein